MKKFLSLFLCITLLVSSNLCVNYVKADCSANDGNCSFNISVDNHSTITDSDLLGGTAVYRTKTCVTLFSNSLNNSTSGVWNDEKVKDYTNGGTKAKEYTEWPNGNPPSDRKQWLEVPGSRTKTTTGEGEIKTLIESSITEDPKTCTRTTTKKYKIIEGEGGTCEKWDVYWPKTVYNRQTLWLKAHVDLTLKVSSADNPNWDKATSGTNCCKVTRNTGKNPISGQTKTDILNQICELGFGPLKQPLINAKGTDKWVEWYFTGKDAKTHQLYNIEKAFSSQKISMDSYGIPWTIDKRAVVSMRIQIKINCDRITNERRDDLVETIIECSNISDGVTERYETETTTEQYCEPNQPKYGVYYNMLPVQGVNMTLPKEINSFKPVDSNKYPDGTKLYAIDPSQLTFDTTEAGKKVRWIFTGYDDKQLTINGKQVIFNGRWFPIIEGGETATFYTDMGYLRGEFNKGFVEAYPYTTNYNSRGEATVVNGFSGLIINGALYHHDKDIVILHIKDNPIDIVQGNYDINLYAKKNKGGYESYIDPKYSSKANLNYCAVQKWDIYKQYTYYEVKITEVYNLITGKATGDKQYDLHGIKDSHYHYAGEKDKPIFPKQVDYKICKPIDLTTGQAYTGTIQINGNTLTPTNEVVKLKVTKDNFEADEQLELLDTLQSQGFTVEFLNNTFGLNIPEEATNIKLHASVDSINRDLVSNQIAQNNSTTYTDESISNNLKVTGIPNKLKVKLKSNTPGTYYLGDGQGNKFWTVTFDIAPTKVNANWWGRKLVLIGIPYNMYFLGSAGYNWYTNGAQSYPGMGMKTAPYVEWYTCYPNDWIDYPYVFYNIGLKQNVTQPILYGEYKVKTVGGKQ